MKDKWIKKEEPLLIVRQSKFVYRLLKQVMIGVLIAPSRIEMESIRCSSGTAKRVQLAGSILLSDHGFLRVSYEGESLMRKAFKAASNRSMTLATQKQMLQISSPTEQID